MIDAITIINRYVRRPATTSEDTFRELRLDDIDRLCIAHDIETAFHCELSDREVERWDCVSDVQRTLERVASRAEAV